MNSKGFERKQSWLNRGTIREFSWTEVGKPRKPTVRIAGVPAKIRTQRPMHTSLEHHRYAILFG
jgi:hypothetical protein